MHEWIFEDQGSKTKKTKKPDSIPDKSELGVLAEHVRRNQRQLKEGLDRLQNSLDNLRLVTKYRVFDLEATRRENARLKKLLEEGRENENF
jgi:hypothetical protein